MPRLCGCRTLVKNGVVFLYYHEVTILRHLRCHLQFGAAHIDTECSKQNKTFFALKFKAWIPLQQTKGYNLDSGQSRLGVMMLLMMSIALIISLKKVILSYI